MQGIELSKHVKSMDCHKLKTFMQAEFRSRKCSLSALEILLSSHYHPLPKGNHYLDF